MSFPSPVRHLKTGRHGTWSSGTGDAGSLPPTAAGVPIAPLAADRHHDDRDKERQPAAAGSSGIAGEANGGAFEGTSALTAAGVPEVMVEVGGWKVVLTTNPRTGHLLVQARTPAVCPHAHHQQPPRGATVQPAAGGGRSLTASGSFAVGGGSSSVHGGTEEDKGEVRCKLFRCCGVKGTMATAHVAGSGERSGRASATVVNNPIFNNPKLKRIIGPSSPAHPRRSRSRSRSRRRRKTGSTTNPAVVTSPSSSSATVPTAASSASPLWRDSVPDDAQLSFNTLPEEVQLHVFSFLSPVDVLSVVPATCRHWRDLTHDETLWKVLQEEHFGGPRRSDRSWHQECVLALTRIKRQTQRYQTEMLLWGAKHGHTQFVRRMLREFNIDVNVRSHKSEASSLHLAAAQGHYDTVELLLAHGANVNARTSYGRTPLERAARFGHATVVQLLIFRGANVNATTEGGETPLLMAAGNNHKKVVKILLNHDADVTAASAGFTAMRIATLQGYSEVVRLLQKHALAQPSVPGAPPASTVTSALGGVLGSQ